MRLKRLISILGILRKINDMQTRKHNLPTDYVVEQLKKRRFFSGIQRYAYSDYDVEHALSIIEMIGKTRRPDFVIDEDNRFAYTNFIKWCHCDTSMQALDPHTGENVRGDLLKGIYIAGPTGSGKSWCLDILLAYAEICKFKIRFSEDDKDRSLYWYTVRSDEICASFCKNGNLNEFKKVQILGIQDFGQEPIETLHMGNRQNVLQQLLEYRGDQGALLTLISSNLSLKSELLKTKYGDRVQSRLVEMCNYLEIRGKDRRLTR